jgi:hypothetical protein
MMKIRDIFQEDIERTIEEVIKVDQVNEAVVYDELREYVPTEALQGHFRDVLEAIVASRTDPTEGIGVWVSGFFGSGKSSFAKVLGYVLAQRTVEGRSAADIFNQRVTNDRLKDLIKLVNSTIPCTVVMFDLATDRAVRTGRENVSEVMYRALLRTLGYVEDPDLAELEIALEGEGRLEAFQARFRELHGKAWDERKHLIAFALNEASAVMHDLDPQTYPLADSWAKTRREVHVDANLIADRAFELMRRRRPDKALVFIVDEVGQYVARHVDRMLDLQGIVQALGRAGKNWVQRGKGPFQAWLVVTSQEKLSEVVDALGDRRIELARLQDRFPDRLRVDLAPTDITEVTSRRVLTKTPTAEAALRERFSAHHSRLATYTHLQKTSRRQDLDERGFVHLYPFLPYQIDLIIEIVSGLRNQPGASRHTGGSNRTIIKHAQQMIINPRTKLGEQPVGRLVTLEQVYDLLEGNLTTERRKDIADVAARLSDVDPMVLKVVKALALLEFVRDLPRTPDNIAAVLYDRVDGGAIVEQVQASLEHLEEAQFAREMAEGWKLQTALEKDWDTERRSHYPKPAQRKELRLEILRTGIFDEPQVRSYRYRNLRTFRLAVSADGRTVTDGDIPLSLFLAEDEADLQRLKDEARETSRPGTPGENTLYWVVPMTQKVQQGLVELYRSREMIALHEREAKSRDEYALVQSEKDRRDTISRTLRADLAAAFPQGLTYFRGVEKAASSWGQSLADALKAFLDKAVPDLYPKFDLGAYPADERDAQKFLTAANLSGLPTLYHEGKDNMGLIRRDRGRFVVDRDAATAAEAMGYIQRMHGYGEKVTGRALEDKFQGLEYGWDVGVVKVSLAALMRAGSLEISYQGRRHRDYREPAVREVFGKVPAFRSAAFAPREALDFTILSTAARNFERIYGRELDLEEGAITQAVVERAREEREFLLPLEARVKALRLPGADFLTEFRATLEGLIASAPDDVVKTFASDGQDYSQAREQMHRIAEGTAGGNLETLRQAQTVVTQQWPALAARRPDDDPVIVAGARLRDVLGSDSVYERLADIGRDAAEIAHAYQELYTDQHQRRRRVYEEAIATVEAHPEWGNLPQEAQEQVLVPLVSRACGDLRLEETTCHACRATLDQIASDLAAVTGLRGQALERIDELTAAQAPVVRVRLAEFFSGVILEAEELDRRVEALREHLQKLLAEGARIVFE